MVNMNQRYNRLNIALIVAPIVNQTCTFQCLIPMSDLLKIGVVMHRPVSKDL